MPASSLNESFYNPTEEHALLRRTVRQLARTVGAPPALTDALPDLAENASAACEYDAPPAAPHESKLLPGAVLPPPPCSRPHHPQARAWWR